MGWSDDGKVAVVQGGDTANAVAFGECKEPGVGAAQAQIGVLDNEITDSPPVIGGQRFEMQLLVEDRLVEQRLDARAELAVEEVGGLGDDHGGRSQRLRLGVE